MDQRGRTVEKLEVESEKERERRIRAALEKLNNTSSSSTSGFSKDSRLPPFDFGDRKTYPVPPPHHLLSRVQEFLPQMEASNAILSQRARADPQSIDIETIEEGAHQYIEMNLGLGVFEQRKKPSKETDEDANMSSTSSSSNTSSESDSDYDSDSSSEIITCPLPAARLIRPLPKRSATRPKIVVIGGDTTRSSK